jgi:hypothetical protein
LAQLLVETAEEPAMWIALGIIGVLWIVGAVVAPDKNGPGIIQAPHAAVSQQATPPAH